MIGAKSQWNPRRTLPGLGAFVIFLLLLWPASAGAVSTGSGAVVMVGTDSNIYYCNGNCDKPRCITCPIEGMHVRRDDGVLPVQFRLAQEMMPPMIPRDEPPQPQLTPPQESSYSWPVISPDGKRIAYSSLTHNKKGASFGVWVYDIATSEATRIFTSASEATVYLVWVPDSKHIAFLVTEPNALSLMLAEARAGAPIRIVANGMPMFFAWHDASTVAVHTSTGSEHVEQVTLNSLASATQQSVKVLSHGRSPFKAPCWSPDGKMLAYVANYQAQSNLVVTDADGLHPRSIVSLPVGENAFVWSGDSKSIAYSTSIDSEHNEFSGIRVVDVAQAESHTLTQEQVDAFFYSPDSRYLAYVVAPSDQQYYTWKLRDLKSGATRTLGNFLTTNDEALTYHYFDQVAVSHSIWAPDSKSFVFAGVPVVSMPQGSLPMAPPPSVWVVPVDGKAPREIQTGTLAFFSNSPTP